MGLKLVPVRLVVQKSRLQLNEDLPEKTRRPHVNGHGPLAVSTG